MGGGRHLGLGKRLGFSAPQFPHLLNGGFPGTASGTGPDNCLRLGKHTGSPQC